MLFEITLHEPQYKALRRFLNMEHICTANAFAHHIALLFYPTFFRPKRTQQHGDIDAISAIISRDGPNSVTQCEQCWSPPGTCCTIQHYATDRSHHSV